MDGKQDAQPVEWLDKAGIAAHLGVKPPTIDLWLKLDDPIPGSRPGGRGHWRFDRREVDAWLRGQGRSAA